MGEEVIYEKKRFSKTALIIIVCVIILAGLLGILFYEVLNGEIEEIKTCGDSTISGTCSLSKPYFCSGENLIDNAGVCGCPEVLDKPNGHCDSEYFNSPIDLTLKYIIGGEEKTLDFTFYKGVVDYLGDLPRSIYYAGDEIPRRDDFKLKKIDDDLQKEALMPLVVKIQNLAPNSKEEQAKIAVSLIQNIPYSEPEFESVFGGLYNIRIARYPYQVLYENNGSCEGKSELLAFLLREIGYGVSLFYYQEENHEALGIKCPLQYSFGGSGYCFIETTMPSPISYSEGRYLGPLGSNKLISSPEIVLISEGISLSKNLEEYEDSKDLTRIVNRIDTTGKINFLEKRKFDELREKYGLLY